MYRKIICLLYFKCLLLFCVSSRAQDASKLPKYFNDLFEAQTDSAKVEAYRDLCFNFSLMNPDSGIYFGKKGLDIALKINFTKGIGDCYNSLGWCYSRKGLFNDADENLKHAKKYFEKTGNRCFVSVSVANIGNMFFLQNRMAEALENYLESVRLSEGCPDEGFKSSGLYSIGAIYNSQKEYKKSVEWFKRANEINIENKDTGKLAECINGIGNAFLGLKIYDSAMVYFNQSSELFNAVNNLNGVAFANESIGSLYLEQKNYLKALSHFEVALNNFRTINSKPDECYELMVIGDTYQEKGETNSAIYYHQMALQIADSNKYASMQQQALTSLSNLHAEKGDFKNAYGYFKRSSAIKDSIGTERQQAKLDELKTKFETEQKDKQIELLNKDKEIEQANAAKQRQLKNVFIGGVVMLLLVALVLYNRYSIKRKSEIALTQKNELIRQEKERAERSEKFKQQFLANMSHEIRTPLNAVSGMTELLQDTGLTEQQKKYLLVIRNSSDNLLTIINDILDLSKIEAGKMELQSVSFNLRDLMDHVRQSFAFKAKEKGIELNVEIEDTIPGNLIGDPTRLTQVLINLAGNAVKFTEKGGVTIKVQKFKSSKEHASVLGVAHLNYERLLFTVEDTGIGIASNQHQGIFESFRQSHSGTTRKYGGTGLGLTISQNLVELMGGKIEVSSQENKGSVFSFVVSFQVSQAIEDGNFATEITSAPLKKNKLVNVLLVEDNEYNQLLVTDALKKKIPSTEITIAGNGRIAIEFLKNEKFDLVLLDISMPEMDGYEVARIIRNDLQDEWNQIPIVAITANVSNSEVEKCHTAGMNDFIAKPFQIAELVNKVAKHTGVENAGIQQHDEQIELPPSGSVTNLTYLLNFTEGNEEEIKKYVNIFLKRIPQSLIEAEHALKNKEEGKVVSVLHSIKPLIGSVGMIDCEKIITELELQKHEMKDNKLLPKFLTIRKQCLAATEELKILYRLQD